MATPAAATPYTLPSRPSSDPAAAALGLVLAALGALRVPERLGITAEELAIVLGSIAALAGLGRAWWHRRLQSQQAAVDAVALRADMASGVPSPLGDLDPTPVTDPEPPGGR